MRAAWWPSRRLLQTPLAGGGHGGRGCGRPYSLSAAKLLDRVDLKPGDVIVQNAADSDAGRALIREARERGVKTINVVGDKPGTADVVEQLKMLGGDIVVTESYTRLWYISRLLNDFPKPKAGINSADGSQLLAVTKLLGPGSTLLSTKKLPAVVQYPGATRRPVKWQDYLKAKNINVANLD
eukprot:SM000037S13509  [mRNA]  locus=s37:383202:384026:+ [translate_table: standard]